MKMSEQQQKTTTAKQQKVSVLTSLASQLHVDPAKLMEVLKKTAFKECRNDEEFIAMCVVANKYGLDPITKEIYAFPNKKTGAVVPVVGYDGWQKLANRNPEYDGCEFVEAEDGSWCECRIYRKDRSRPTAMREYLEECMMDTTPWHKYPRRMLRNKAFNQCARAAFNLSGIYDEDEALRIRACEAEELQKQVAGQQKQTLPFNKRKSAAQLLASKKDEAEEVAQPQPEAVAVPAQSDVVDVPTEAAAEQDEDYPY